jgi:excisionase family DNA binding protein
MSLDEVAEYFGISTATLRRMISSRDLSANRIGRQWRVPIKDIEAREKRTSTERWR